MKPSDWPATPITMEDDDFLALQKVKSTILPGLAKGVFLIGLIVGFRLGMSWQYAKGVPDLDIL